MSMFYGWPWNCYYWLWHTEIILSNNKNSSVALIFSWSGPQNFIHFYFSSSKLFIFSNYQVQWWTSGRLIMAGPLMEEQKCWDYHCHLHSEVFNKKTCDLIMWLHFCLLGLSLLHSHERREYSQVNRDNWPDWRMCKYFVIIIVWSWVELHTIKQFPHYDNKKHHWCALPCLSECISCWKLP